SLMLVPSPRSPLFPYTTLFRSDHCAEIMIRFAERLGLARYTLYMQDYGGPVGFRMALAHPDRIEALIVQDAVAHNEGLGANWKPDRKSTRLNSSHVAISYAVFC